MLGEESMEPADEDSVGCKEMWRSHNYSQVSG